MNEKTPLLHKLVCFQMLNKRLQAWSFLLFVWEITFFSGRAISHNVLYYHQLFIARYHITFYANIILSNYPIVSSAFKEKQLIEPRDIQCY